MSSLHIPYVIPAVLIVAAFSIKLPTFVRAFRDPNVRATTVLLLLASAVFLSIVPASIHKINLATGVPNIAAPWVYSLLTAFCACCLTMIISWREEPSPRRRRRTRRVWIIYSGIIAALWVTFLLADVPEERIYDLDTYYANTPWMREHILLYLVAHLVSALVAAYMIWTWIGEVTERWLRAGIVFLQLGYATGLVFDIAKIAAIGARWTGSDWDALSTQLAPPFALLDGILVAVGFILPQAVPYLQERSRDRATYRSLLPLWRVLHAIDPSPAAIRIGFFAPLDLRLTHRTKDIRDGLLRLLPHLDDTRRRVAYDKAKGAGYDDDPARGIAGAVDILEAVDAFRSAKPLDGSEEAAPISSDLTDIEPISRALRSPTVVDEIRHQTVKQRESHA